MERRGSEKDKARIGEDLRLFCRRKLWKLPGPQTWKILIWKIVTNTLSVGNNFRKRNIGIDANCKLCLTNDMSMEMIEHLFRDCLVSRRLWACSELGIHAELGSHLCITKWLIEWISYLGNLEGGDARVVRFLAMLWCLWSIRNKILFQGLTFHPLMFYNLWAQLVGTADQAMNASDKEVLNTMVSAGTSRTDCMMWIRESKPVCIVGEIRNCDYVRIMVDAGWRGIEKAGIGWEGILGNGQRCCSEVRKIRAESPLQAEGLGVLAVMLWAQEQGIRHLEISRDCISIVYQLAGIERVHHLLKALLKDVFEAATFFHCFAISFIPRSFNKRAHGLACKAMDS
ncbi:uncharacterized protein LOC141628541 [Silene latifolia]|uniref:uncharacterized protein LOC141628541 n=1 Tax=Silene latifolia TaxID=37657 RepID=UPI003D7769BA